MNSYESLLSDAARLSVDDRIQFMEALWETVPVTEFPPLSADWKNEIARRSAEFDAGTVQAIPWSQVQAEALNRIQSRVERRVD